MSVLKFVDPLRVGEHDIEVRLANALRGPAETYAGMWAILAADALEEIRMLRENVKDQGMSFDLRWKADMRAIKRWQAETGEELTWPDHADLLVWLMKRLRRRTTAVVVLAGALLGAIVVPAVVGWALL